jgi:lysophospholipase L1-like esterase
MLLRLALLIALLGFSLKAEDAPKLKTGVSAERVLFLGNSITKHGPAPKIGWNSDWGMAASTEDKDYVHVTAALLGKVTGKAPDIRFKNIADFERNLASYDLEGKLKEELAFKPTLVIVAIGENVPGLGSEDLKTQYKTSYAKLLALFKGNGNPTLVVRSCFWADAAKDSIMKDACMAAGGLYADLNGLSKDESNYGRADKKWEHAGVGAHPGDKGMQAIANAILKALTQ